MTGTVVAERMHGLVEEWWEGRVEIKKQEGVYTFKADPTSMGPNPDLTARVRANLQRLVDELNGAKS
jgi:hypothetical protein